MDADAGHYACPCLNVRIAVGQESGRFADQGATAVEASDDAAGVPTSIRLGSDRLVPKDSAPPVIEVAQPLLTTRVVLPPTSSRPQPLTALACLNCNTNVYAVDKAQQLGKPRSVGFTARGPSTSGTSMAGTSSTSPSPARGIDAEEEDVLRPASGLGSMWILSDCVSGTAEIAKLASSHSFSQSFGLFIPALRQEERGDDGQRSTDSESFRTGRTGVNVLIEADVKRKPSPQRALSSLSDKRTSSSPSPARRRRGLPLAEEEEERGEDLDTLHLLETLLPHLPTSVVHESQVNGEGTTLRRMLAKTAQKSSEKPSTSYKLLDAKLDSVAVARLREKRDEAQKEIYALLKQKSVEIAEAEKQLRHEARQIRATVVRHATSRSEKQQQQQQDASRQEQERRDEEAGIQGEEGAGESTSPLFLRRRPLVPPLLEKTSSQDSDMTRRAGGSSMSGSLGGFQNRDIGTPIPGSHGTAHAPGPYIGSYLSASFAMRGRDLPNQISTPERSKEDEEEWFAHKKRLRERYPHADHSALPSAVNSDDEGAVEVKEPDPAASLSEEEERRGRGRARNTDRGHANAQKTPTPPKRRDNSDEKSQQKRESPRQHQQKDDLSQSMQTKRGALKTGIAERPVPTAEKKVAFASTTEELEAAPAIPEEPSYLENLEPGDSVFEIDEDIDADDSTPTSSDINLDGRSTALQHGKEEIVRGKSTDEESSADLDESPPEQSIVRSLPAVGSFSAMAESQSRRGSHLGNDTARPADEFDPASLRFDGREVYSAGTPDLLPSSPNSHAARETESIREAPASFSSIKEGQRARNLRHAEQALLAGFPNEQLQRSAIGFRVIVGEAEARLSGLLAPHAPSHRNLWSERRRRSAHKYKLQELAEEDDQDETDDDQDGSLDEGLKQESIIKTDVHSHSAAWRHQFEKRSTQGEEAADDMMLARSVPISTQHKLPGRSSSAIHRDETTGFDLEPKTSLPYQEKHLTPSLRKATRHLSATDAPSPRRHSLGTISDASESTASAGASSTNGVVPGRPPMSRESSNSKDAKASKPIDMKNEQPAPIVPDFKYALPGSVTHGFDVGSHHTSSAPARPQFSSSSTSRPAVVAAADSAQSSPMLGSSAGTGRSSRLRSPRPPYVQPPPPASAEMRLTPDNGHRPAALPLAPMTKPDEYEEDEEEQDLDNALKFMHIVENLKRNKRTGWYHHRVEQPESIADHMYRMGVLSMLLPESELNIGKCVQLCLVHDLAESLVGDLTPLDGVAKEEKLQREKEAIGHLVHGLLAGNQAGLRIEALWNEYEERQTAESKAVKDLDRFELALQALEYERRYQTADLQPFYTGSSGVIMHPRIQRWIRTLAKEREQLWKGTPFAYTQLYPDDSIPRPPWAQDEEQGLKQTH